jgi:hypothetical protein
MIENLTGEIMARAKDSALCKMLKRNWQFGVVRYDYDCWGFDGACCFGAKELATYKSEMNQLFPELEYLHDFVERNAAEMRRDETESYETVNPSATLPKHTSALDML